MPTPLEEYLFDLNGYLVLRGVLSPGQVADANARLDSLPDLPRGGWHGWVQREDHPEHRGVSWQQVVELGGAFEALIDAPATLDLVTRFVGGQGSFDTWHGPPSIDENFVTLRGPGEAIPVHSGGHEQAHRTRYHYGDGKFACGQVNVLVALTDIGPGDGATMVIPGSHKSLVAHPAFAERDQPHEWSNAGGGSVDGIAGAVEVHLGAGDAILFVDALCHGSAKRTNAGERIIAVYRYGSSWNRTRFGHQPSPELLARLSDRQRRMLLPREPIRPPGTPPRW